MSGVYKKAAAALIPTVYIIRRSMPGIGYGVKTSKRRLPADRARTVADRVSEIHTASRSTYGSRRVHAELTRGVDITVTERLVAS